MQTTLEDLSCMLLSVYLLSKDWRVRGSEYSQESSTNRNENSGGAHVTLAGSAGRLKTHCLSEICFSLSLLSYGHKYLHSMFMANLTFECLKCQIRAQHTYLTNTVACFPR